MAITWRLAWRLGALVQHRCELTPYGIVNHETAPGFAHQPRKVNVASDSGCELSHSQWLAAVKQVNLRTVTLPLDKPRPTSWRGREAISTDQRYRERAKEAREKAAAASSETSRRTWLEIAKGFERLAEQPEREPVWRVERVKPNKKPR